ncbi:MAG: ABC transporter substrate-binding protein [Acidimicrobiia bacterium]|nr:ABC transporter substrate-binding protein [Acidimicrobiia bacterium]
MKRPFVVFTLVLTIVAACGDSGGATTAATVAGFPREIAGISLDEPPTRIISGSATHTEILFAVGAGDAVVAVDAFSDYPAPAGELPHLDAFNPSVEGFAALDPDLVIVTFDPNDLVGGLGALGIPVWVLDAPTTVEGVYAQIAEIGMVTGHSEEATQVIAGMRADITEIVAGAAAPAGPSTYYHELDPTLFTIGSDTFLGSLYGMLGLTSIADAAGGGYPQLSAEFVIAADPDFVFLGDGACCGQTAETVAQRPGWDAMSAVAEGRVFVVDEALASRWGPRIVDFLAAVAAAVSEPAQMSGEGA